MDGFGCFFLLLCCVHDHATTPHPPHPQHYPQTTHSLLANCAAGFVVPLFL